MILKIIPANADKDSYKLLNLSRSLVISHEASLYVFNIDNKNHKVLLTGKNAINAFDTYTDKTVFFSENNTSRINSLNNIYSEVLHTKRWRPQAIAVDYITEKIYLIDKSSGTLNVIDLNNKHYGVVIPDLYNPHDLALDAAEGLIFIVQQSQGVINDLFYIGMISLIYSKSYYFSLKYI